MPSPVHLRAPQVSRAWFLLEVHSFNVKICALDLPKLLWNIIELLLVNTWPSDSQYLLTLAATFRREHFKKITSEDLEWISNHTFVSSFLCLVSFQNILLNPWTSYLKIQLYGSYCSCENMMNILLSWWVQGIDLTMVFVSWISDTATHGWLKRWVPSPRLQIWEH